jgi:uncharacterized OsmC-like protein
MSHAVEVRLVQQEAFRFDIDFGAGKPHLIGDEGPPIGQGVGPSPVELLAAAVGNCLSDSLHFALAKFKQEHGGISTMVNAEIGRNPEGHLRVTAMQVRVSLKARADTMSHLDRVLSQFEGFCTVAQSVGQGLPIEVQVFDGSGARLK